jgi:uncharacterized integral membrane protein (TIGR00698 family)
VSLAASARAAAPGLALAAVIGLAGWALQKGEEAAFGHAVVEALVLAILLGMAIRTFWKPGERWSPGIRLAGKGVLETAIVLLGASVDLPVLFRAGPALAVGIVAVVACGLAGGYGVGRLLGLSPKLSILVATGNAICGNSAIAAVAPVIEADREDVASSIAFTAVLGVVVVLTLPLLIPLLGLDHYQYGALAGLTVYAVPQVLAATLPVSPLSGDVGTLVKLVRVLLLGPVVVLFSLLHQRRRAATAAPGAASAKVSLRSYVPWFIVGFLLFAALRSSGVLPTGIAGPLREVSRAMTIAAMAALGLGVDVRALRQVGPRVIAAVTASLLILIAASTLLIKGWGIG